MCAPDDWGRPPNAPPEAHPIRALLMPILTAAPHLCNILHHIGPNFLTDSSIPARPRSNLDPGKLLDQLERHRDFHGRSRGRDYGTSIGTAVACSSAPLPPRPNLECAGCQ